MTTHIDVVAQFDHRSVMVSANDLKRNLERTGDDAGDAYGKGFVKGADGRLRDERGRFVKAGQDLGGDVAKGMGEGFERNLPRFKAGMGGAVTATREYRDEFKKLQDLMRSGAAWEVVAAQSERVARSHNLARTAARDAGDAFKEFENAGKSLTSSATATTGTLTDLGSAIGKLGNVAGPAAVVGLGAAIVQLGGIAASAAQSLTLIPAAAGAAGAAIGTVALATHGFGDAMKSVGDPQKFAEALKQLSPNAQQAALSIQGLMPAFTELRMATSDAFFANVGPQLNQLTNQFLPTIQAMTTGIASAMNQMFSGVASQLMTPETQASVQAFTTNVVSAFQALAPAVAPLTKAFADLMAVGSGFLPDLARSAADAARSFSTFITEAKNSGELKKWLGEGIDTLGQLGGIAMDLGKAFMQLAPMGREILPQIANMLQDIQSIMPAIAAASLLLGPPIGLWTTSIKQASGSFEAIKSVVQGVYNFVQPILEKFRELILGAMGPLGVVIDQASKLGVLGDSGRGAGGVGGGASVPKIGAGLTTAGLGTGIARPEGTGLGSTTLGIPNNPLRGTWSTPAGNPFASPTTPGGGRGSGLPTSPAVPFDTSLPPGFEGLPQTPALYSAQSSYMDANTNLAEKRARVDQLEKSSVATADDVQKARNDVIMAERNQHEAELRLYDARQDIFDKNTKQLKGYADQMGEIGAKLDQDLGISKGLPGIADNLVRFLASLAAAPALGKLDAIANAPGQAKGGFGLMGILGAQGVFGPQFTAEGQAAASSSSSGASVMGPAALQPGGAYPGDAALLSNVRPGRYSQDPSRDLLKGLSDCSSSIGDLVGLLDTGSTEGPNLTTGNAAQWLPQHGFLPGMGGPGDFRVGYNGGHMQATLPGGTPWNWGSDAAAARGGVGGTGADDPAFTQHYYRPAGGVPGAVSSGAPVTINATPPSGSVGQSFPVPLPVTIVGGHGGGGGIPVGGATPVLPGQPGVAPGSATAPGYAPGSPVDIYSPANTNPGLNNPPAPGAPQTNWGTGAPIGGAPMAGGPPGTGMPRGMPGGAPSGFPGAGAGAGTQIGGVDPLQGIGKGGGGMTQGGSIDSALGMAASALDVMAPGAGQAAQVGIKLANRAIQYGGQVAGIMTQGALDTFLPFGGSKLAQGSWLTKIVGGLAGAVPALPNMAGKAAAAPEGQAQQGQPQGGNTTTNNISVKEDPNRGADGTGRDIAYHAQNMYQPAGMP